MTVGLQQLPPPVLLAIPVQKITKTAPDKPACLGLGLVDNYIESCRERVVRYRELDVVGREKDR